MKKIYPLLLFVLLLFSNSVWSQITAKVVGIKDGDTVVVLLDGNIQKTLRLAEVDCPESSQPFGKNAKQFTSSLIFGKMISFIETDTDRYGRTIAKIYYENKYLSAEIIKAGFGWWYSQYSNNKNLGVLQQSAKQRKIGLWQDSSAVAPWEFRTMQRESKKAN